MGCGASANKREDKRDKGKKPESPGSGKRNSHLVNNTSHRRETEDADNPKNAPKDGAGGKKKPGGKDTAPLTAREKLVYERPSSDDGMKCDEPIAPVASLKRGWQQLRAKLMDHVHGKDDIESRAEFEMHLANYRPGRKLVNRVSFWMDEVFEAVEEEQHGTPKFNIHMSVADSSGAVPSLPCYLDRVLAENAKIVEAGGQGANESEKSTENDTSMHAGSLMTSIKSLGSDASLKRDRNTPGFMKRSPQTRLVANGGTAGAGGGTPAGVPSPANTGGFAVFDTNESGQFIINDANAGTGPGRTGSAGAMDDVDMLMFGGVQHRESEVSLGQRHSVSGGDGRAISTGS